MTLTSCTLQYWRWFGETVAPKHWAKFYDKTTFYNLKSASHLMMDDNIDFFCASSTPCIRATLYRSLSVWLGKYLKLCWKAVDDGLIWHLTPPRKGCLKSSNVWSAVAWNPCESTDRPWINKAPSFEQSFKHTRVDIFMRKNLENNANEVECICPYCSASSKNNNTELKF